MPLKGYSKNFRIFENLSGLSLAILSGLELAFWTFWEFCPEYRKLETASPGSQICPDHGKQPPQSPKIMEMHLKYLILLPDNRTTSYMKKESETINSVTGRLTAGKWINYVLGMSCCSFWKWTCNRISDKMYFFPTQIHSWVLKTGSASTLRVVGRCQKANWQCQYLWGEEKKQSSANKNVDKIYQQNKFWTRLSKSIYV